MNRMALSLGLSLATFVLNTTGGFAQDADNTKKNAREYSGHAPTAQNQSNEKSAVDRTAKLRRAIMAKKGLSVNAQNVKIIDEGGCMTLRGPVDSAREKKIIGNLAKQCCGAHCKYKNELEVRSQK